jgi:hypothetical protein
VNNDTFHYHGDGQGDFPAGVIAAKVAANPAGRHLVWKNGWDGWKEAKTVPEIMNAGGPPMPPPPPPFPG